jgi:hypothetical protein
VIGYINPFPYREGGYNYGVGCIYLPPATATLLTWGSSYILAIQGNPSYFTSIPDYRVTLSSSNYSTKTTQTDNQTEMGKNIVNNMNTLSLNWGTSLTQSIGKGEILSSSGALYLQGAIPGIQYMCPAIMPSVIGAPDYANSKNWTTAQADAYGHRFDTTTWVGNMTAGVGGLLGGSANMGAGLIVAGFALFCIVFATVKYQDVFSGFLASILVLTCGYLVGWMPAAMYGIIIFVIVLYTGIVMFLNRS